MWTVPLFFCLTGEICLSHREHFLHIFFFLIFVKSTLTPSNYFIDAHIIAQFWNMVGCRLGCYNKNSIEDNPATKLYAHQGKLSSTIKSMRTASTAIHIWSITYIYLFFRIVGQRCDIKRRAIMLSRSSSEIPAVPCLLYNFFLQYMKPVLVFHTNTKYLFGI